MVDIDRYVIQTIFSALFYRVFKSYFVSILVLLRGPTATMMVNIVLCCAHSLLKCECEHVLTMRATRAACLSYRIRHSLTTSACVLAKKYVHTRLRVFLLQTRAAQGMLDRSPCGTGTCAVMATMHARGELAVGVPFVHESIIGSHFTGEIVGTTTVAGIPGESTAQPRAHTR
jgi:hypothetical protein